MALRILIVEDSVSIRMLYQEVLHKAGYEVEVATDGQVALRLAQAQPFDCIVVDMLMPNLDGLAFLKAFDCRRHPKTRVIMASNLDDPQKREQALALGAAAYIIKAEVSLPELLRKIDPTRPAPGASAEGVH
ncbi:MAG TPA: response regulator [Candidatus Saccharimonadia bacterium]|nr:response regulator [Candidatus Saccharimonadia bacterium]